MTCMKICSACSTQKWSLILSLPLPSLPEELKVQLQGLLGRTGVMEFDSKLLASLPNDGGDLGVVGLNDSREEVVGNLVVEGS